MGQAQCCRLRQRRCAGHRCCHARQRRRSHASPVGCTAHVGSAARLTVAAWCSERLRTGPAAGLKQPASTCMSAGSPTRRPTGRPPLNTVAQGGRVSAAPAGAAAKQTALDKGLAFSWPRCLGSSVGSLSERARSRASWDKEKECMAADEFGAAEHGVKSVGKQRAQEEQNRMCGGDSRQDKYQGVKNSCPAATAHRAG